MGIADEIRNNQDQKYEELVDMLFDLILDDCKLASSKGYDSCYARLKDYILVLDSEYKKEFTKSYDVISSKIRTPEEAQLWAKVRGMFFEFNDDLKNSENKTDTYGMNYKNAEKLSISLQNKFIDEGFKVEIDYESALECLSLEPISSYKNDSVWDFSFCLNISW